MVKCIVNVQVGNSYVTTEVTTLEELFKAAVNSDPSQYAYVEMELENHSIQMEICS